MGIVDCGSGTRGGGLFVRFTLLYAFVSGLLVGGDGCGVCREHDYGVLGDYALVLILRCL